MAKGLANKYYRSDIDMIEEKNLLVVIQDPAKLKTVTAKRFTDISANVTIEKVRPVIHALAEIWDFGDIERLDFVETHSNEYNG